MTTATKTSTPSSPAITLVVGGTGKTGRRVAERLARRGLPVRIASRSGSPAFDWNRPEHWPALLDGVGAVYLTFAPDLAMPGAADAIAPFVRAAVEHGVGRIVLLSGRGEPQCHAAERVVLGSGAQATVLRAAWFAQNFSEGHLADQVASGELAFLPSAAGEPFIDVDDIADVAVAALTSDGHGGQIYELTGPRLLTFDDAMAEISRASGRDVRYLPVPKAAYAEALAAVMPAEEVAFLTDLFEFLVDGHNAYVTDGVQRVLGRPARDFRDYARDAAAGGAWKA